VTKTIVPKKKVNCFIDPCVSTSPRFTDTFFPWKKSFERKRPDKTIRRIPKQRGKRPVPAILKVPIGIPKERRAVTVPKRKITIPPIASSLFNLLSSFFIFAPELLIPNSKLVTCS
jgi:hypothetical protein